MMGTRAKYFDISPEISESIAVFPGDTPFSRKVTVNFNEVSPGKVAAYQASSIHGSVHLGAHADAPNHYSKSGEGIESRDLDRYMGLCQVIDMSIPRSERITPAHFQGKPIRAPRVLFKTGSFPNPNHWNGDFNSLSAELVNFLSDKGVTLVGIDTPSIDLANDQKLESHQVVAKKDMAVLEGIILGEVPEGLYQLIALPLRIRGADASPVRAILLPLEFSLNNPGERL